MKSKMRYWTLKFFLLILLTPIISFAQTINIIAAENFYADIARQIGGSHVNVESILNNPNQDPHTFSVNPSIAKTLSTADIIIYNGIGYDNWIKPLIKTNSSQTTIVVADLLGAKPGNNPHIWFEPNASLLLAKKLFTELKLRDPKHNSAYLSNFTAFSKRHALLLQKIQTMRQQYKDTPIIATESLFYYMAQALGFEMHGQDFQLSIMNDVPPSPKQIANFENDLTQHKVKLLIYNTQVLNPITDRMKALALKNNIPVVGISETAPTGSDFFSWMLDNLNRIATALLTGSRGQAAGQ